jgi:hypothetical protein
MNGRQKLSSAGLLGQNQRAGKIPEQGRTHEREEITILAPIWVRQNLSVLHIRRLFSIVLFILYTGCQAHYITWSSSCKLANLASAMT